MKNGGKNKSVAFIILFSIYIYIYIYIYNMQCMQLFSMHTLSEKKAHKLSLYRCPFKRYKYVLFGYKYTFLVVICI